MKFKCKKDLIMQPAAVAGKEYQAWDNDDTFTIRNEQGELHNFSKDPQEASYYGNWFELEV